MIEFSHGFFNLEQPAPGSTVAAGHHVLKGWLVGHPGTALNDLRIRLADQLWPAVYGYFRPDLAAHFKAPTPLLPAAYEARVYLAPGEAKLQFESLGIDGQWRAVHQVTLHVAAPAAAPFVPDAEAPVSGGEFAELLRHLLRECAATPSETVPAVVRRVVAQLPCPRYLLHPTAPFHAFFREPAIITRAAYGRLLVDGYLFHESQAIVRVLATFDLQVWQPVAHGGESPIAPQLFPQFPFARTSNVKGYIECPSQLPQPRTLRLYADLADGSRHLVAVQQTFTYGLEEEKRPFAPTSAWAFWRLTRALRAGLLAAGIGAPTGPEFRQTVWREWRRVAALAPRRRALATGFAEDGDAAIFATDHFPSSTTPLGEVMVFTQNLDLEGAPLLLLEYCRHLIVAGGAQLTLVSAAEGPLRAQFTAAGATVRIVDARALTHATSPSRWRGALAQLAADLDVSRARLIVANTLTSYWAIHLAARVGRPSLFYIHESTTPTAFFHGTAARTILPFVEASFALATRVSFNTASSAHYYLPFAGRGNYHLNPGWIDLARLDAHRATHSRASLRAALGVPPERKLVVNLGAVCERKGQHVFAWAVDLLWLRRPDLAAQTEFWMVGARHTPFDTSMADLVAGLNRPNLRLIPETPRAYDYLGAADLFTCSSYEESFPRVLLEAMALDVPILSTAVHGVPAMVTHDREAWLVPPGDSSQLADGLAHLLASPADARAYAQNARARVAAHFDTAHVLPRQLALAHGTIATHAASR